MSKANNNRHFSTPICPSKRQQSTQFPKQVQQPSPLPQQAVIIQIESNKGYAGDIKLDIKENQL